MYAVTKFQTLWGLYDCIPVCVLADACDILPDPMSELFEKIYATGLLPEQWKISLKYHPNSQKGWKNLNWKLPPHCKSLQYFKNFQKVNLKANSILTWILTCFNLWITSELIHSEIKNIIYYSITSDTITEWARALVVCDN